MINPDNKAVSKLMDIPPALLEAIANGDEEALSGAARVQLAFLMERMTQRCADPATSPSAVASIMEILRKMASANSTAADKAAGPGVIINITRARDNTDAITIEGKTVPDKLAIEA